MPDVIASSVLMAVVCLLVCLAWYPCCTDPTDCAKCSGNTPDTITVEFTGYTEGSAACGDCNAELNASFILDQDPTNECGWKWSELDYMCSPASDLVIYALVTEYAGGNKKWRVNVSLPAYFDSQYFDHDYAATLDCEAEAELEYETGTAYGCDPTTATCTIN